MTQHFTWPLVLVTMGGLLSVAGGLWSTLRNSQEAARTAAARADSEKALREKAEEIARLNHELKAMVTGGDAFPVVMPIQSGDSLHLFVMNKGKFPLYDLSVSVADLREFAKRTAPGRLEDVLAARANFTIGNLAPNVGQMFTAINMLGATKAAYNIFSLARNGSVTEMLRLRKVGPKWFSAVRVTARDGTTVLDEEVDREFPRGPGGSVEWEDRNP